MIFRPIVKFLLIVCLIQLGASVAWAAPDRLTQPLATARTYYVATNGSDANAGTQNQPFRTLNTAVSVLQPGDTLLIGSGTYAEYLNNVIPSGQSWSVPVTVASVPGSIVIIKPPVGADNVVRFKDNSQFIILSGLVFDAANATYFGIKFDVNPGQPTPHHIRIINSEVKNGNIQGIITSPDANYLEFINLSVHDNGHNDFQHGIYLEGSYNTISGCTFYNNAGWGIHLYGGTDSFNVIYNNRIYDNAHVGTRGFGIGVYIGQGNLVYNNLIWGGNDGGINVDFGATNTKVYANTLYNNRDYGIFVGSASVGTEVKNNIIVQASGIALTDHGAGTQLASNLLTDPLFVDVSAANFHLRAGSPAIDRGSTLPEVPVDFDGVSRPQNGVYDIGAYEFSSGASVRRADTIGVYSNGVFYLRNSNTPGSADIIVPFNPFNVPASRLRPVTGDWNGDGIDSIGVYDTQTGVFLLRNSNTGGAANYTFVLGNPGDTPVAGRWDASMTGDGAGVFRPSNGLLYLKKSLVSGFADYTMVLGNPGDSGIAGDWDGNGYASIGVFRPSGTMFYLSNTVGGTTGIPKIVFSDYNFVLGSIVGQPIAGDWTASGQTRVGLYLNGVMYLRNSLTVGAPDAAIAFGAPGAYPVAGHWTSAVSSPTSLESVLVAPAQSASKPNAATPSTSDDSSRYD